MRKWIGVIQVVGCGRRRVTQSLFKEGLALRCGVEAADASLATSSDSLQGLPLGSHTFLVRLLLGHGFC